MGLHFGSLSRACRAAASFVVPCPSQPSALSSVLSARKRCACNPNIRHPRPPTTGFTKIHVKSLSERFVRWTSKARFASTNHRGGGEKTTKRRHAPIEDRLDRMKWTLHRIDLRGDWKDHEPRLATTLACPPRRRHKAVPVKGQNVTV
jgi:hypothetical protein